MACFECAPIEYGFRTTSRSSHLYVLVVCLHGCEVVNQFHTLGGNHGVMGNWCAGMVVRGAARALWHLKCGRLPAQSGNVAPLQSGPNAPRIAQGGTARGLLGNFHFQGEL